MKRSVRQAFSVAAVILWGGLAHGSDPSPAELWTTAQAKKAKGDAKGYITDTNRAASVALDQLAVGKLELGAKLPWLEESIAMPDGSIAKAIAPDILFAWRHRLITKLSMIPIKRQSATLTDFSNARRSVADACVGFFGAVYTASLATTIARAEADVKIAKEALDSLQIDAPLQPSELSLASGSSFAHIKDSKLRTALERHRDANTDLRIARNAQQQAVEHMPGLTRDVAAVIQTLYKQAPIAESEVGELLRKHGLEKSPLAIALNKQ